jgi:hypothetical protein
MYEGTYNDHHKRTTYGTTADPEYLPLAGRPWTVGAYLAFALAIGPLLLVRFLLSAPVSWLIPLMRRALIRHASTYPINPWYRRAMPRAERRRLFAWECAILLPGGRPSR